MVLERQLHDFIVNACGGRAKDVKGISGTRLSKLKQGNSGISTKKLVEVLKANDIGGRIELEHGNGLTTIIELYSYE